MYIMLGIPPNTLKDMHTSKYSAGVLLKLATDVKGSHGPACNQFHFIPKVLHGADVRALCGHSRFLYADLGKPSFVHEGVAVPGMSKRKGLSATTKLGMHPSVLEGFSLLGIK